MTVLLWNLSKQLTGFMQYRPYGLKKGVLNCPRMGRYFVRGNAAMFGTETLHFSPNLLFVTEGMFDACRFHNLGLSAVAVFSNDPKHLYTQLQAFKSYKTVVTVTDTDKAGSELLKFSDYTVSVPKPYKDVGEMPPEEFYSFVKGLNLC